MIGLKRLGILIKKALKGKRIFKPGCTTLSTRDFVKTGYARLLCFSSYRSFPENGDYKKWEENIFMP